MGGSIDVKPGSLEAASHSIKQIAGNVRSTAASPQGTGAGIGDQACEAAFDQALNLVGTETGHIATWMDTLSTNVLLASGHYTQTDDSVIPGMPGVITGGD
jgi:Excreted virulence factor EspC, type VII ESX diderm